MSDDLDFSLSSYDETQAKEAGKVSTGPIPNGVYKLACIKCESYVTSGTDKNPPHKALRPEFVIVDGEFKARHLFVNYVRADGSAKMPDLHAWYKMTGLADKKVAIKSASDFIGTEIVAPVVQEKSKTYTDKSTGKVYPERIVNRVVFTIDDPAKVAKSAVVPTITESSATGKSPVDRSDDWK